MDSNRITGQLRPNTEANFERRPVYVFQIMVYDDGLQDDSGQNIEIGYAPVERIGENGARAKNLNPSDLEMFTAAYLFQSILATYNPEIAEWLKAKARMFKQANSEPMQNARRSKVFRDAIG